MSWGTQREGTVESVTAEVTQDFDNFGKTYAPGTLEGDDVAVARARVFALLAGIDLSHQDYYEDGLVRVSANGSHGWSGSKENPTSAGFSVKVERIGKSQK